MNMRFEYLYRDSANNELWGSVVFTNREKYCNMHLSLCVLQILNNSRLFHADQVAVPDLSFDSWDAELDHDWHEFYNFEETAEAADDALHRDVCDLIDLFEKSAAAWKQYAAPRLRR